MVRGSGGCTDFVPGPVPRHMNGTENLWLRCQTPIERSAGWPAEASRSPIRKSLSSHFFGGNRYILSALRSVRVEALNREEVAALHQGMRDKPYQASRTLGVLSK